LPGYKGKEGVNEVVIIFPVVGHFVCWKTFPTRIPINTLGILNIGLLPHFKMETLRDATFGQACRLFSRWRLFQYPEERDLDYVQGCTINLNEAARRDRVAREANPAIGSGEHYTNYTLTAQVSRARSPHRNSSINSTKIAADLEEGSQVLIVGWAGPNDPQVVIFKSPDFFEH
jgi:hypothetical protein